jgi:hypothetical protein
MVRAPLHKGRYGPEPMVSSFNQLERLLFTRYYVPLTLSPTTRSLLISVSFRILLMTVWTSVSNLVFTL